MRSFELGELLTTFVRTGHAAELGTFPRPLILAWGDAGAEKFNRPLKPLTPIVEALLLLIFQACAGELLQLRVFRFGLFQDGDVSVAVFPQCKEVLIRRTGLA